MTRHNFKTKKPGCSIVSINGNINNNALSLAAEKYFNLIISCHLIKGHVGDFCLGYNFYAESR